LQTHARDEQSQQRIKHLLRVRHRGRTSWLFWLINSGDEPRWLSPVPSNRLMVMRFGKKQYPGIPVIAVSLRASQ
jgi:hypothetical protein